MANLVRNFIKGRMNKSVDERLVPDGEYIHAENIRMGSTEDSEIGAIENTKGNEQLTTLVYPPTGTALSTSATCIGAYADGANETIYWFVHDPAFVDGTYSGVLDLIVSLNTRSELLTYHVVSTSALSFDPQHLITGVDLVDDLLFFTDDTNPPRRINIGKAYPEPVAFVDDPLLEQDVLVIKAPPAEAPNVEAVEVDSREDFMEDRFLCFGYRWEYDNNEYSATSQFSAPIFESKPFAFSEEEHLNVGMENSVQACSVTVDTGNALVKGIDILFKEMDDSIIRVIEKVDKADAALADDTTYTIQFSKRKIFTILPESEILRLYDNVPRLAKAQTLMGNRIVYGNYLEGYNLKNVNGLNVKFGFVASLIQTPLDNADPDVETPAYYSRTSLHSNRNYEVGIVYMDEFGRSSTALVAPNNKVEIECGQSIFQNQIRVTIPALMLPPSWASRYKFVIKSDADLYETIYTNQFAEFGNDVYFLLEGENAAKVEKGDRYIVKRDTSGAVTSCTYAKVLEKKAYGVGELDDSDPAAPVPAVSGTYMKMKPDFSYDLPTGVSNTNPGQQSAGTNFGDDFNTESGSVVTPGYYPVLAYTGFDNDDILAGSRIRLTMSFTRQGRGDAVCETRTLDFDHTWTVDQDYTGTNPIVDWFYDTANNDVIVDIESATGVSGDPDVDAPTNSVLAVTSTGAPAYGILGDELVNQMRWYVPPGGDPEFIIFGTKKCTAITPLPTNGMSPNRRSRVKAQWTITRATQAVVFETEPTPALPDLWYESSESYPIALGYHQGNVQNQGPAQNAIIDTAFFNCITYGNGVESYKIRDSVSGKPMLLGNRVTTTSDERFSEVRRFADLTYSGVINDETNINKLNEFNLGLLNFKPLEDSYGPVEKLFGRRTDILTLQEDKISYVLAEKNLLTDATGASLVTSVPEVLGQQVARVEDFGISNNPESFAEWGPHKFFTDAKRGAVIHLFGDGQKEQLEVISEQGMRSWFRDEFIESFNTQKLGGYDPYMNEYVLASNDVFLPGEEPCIACNTVQTFVLTAAQQTFCVNLGNETGPVSIDYNIIEADDADSATISTTYGGTTVVTGPITNASQPSVPDVNKNSITDNEVTIDLDYTGSERFVLQVQVKCPQKQNLNVRLITVNRTVDAGKAIHSEFQWQDGVFVSPLSSTAVKFQSGTDPVVSDWQEYTVAQGSNLGPTDGSTVNMIYNRIAPDNYTLRASDRFRYLRSDTLYREADVVALLADSDLSEITPAGAQPEYTGDFLMPGTGQYLYLVWDYTDGSTPPAEFLLDTYTGAAAAYSVRRLATATTVLLRVRRDTAGGTGHDDEADVAYDSNDELSLDSAISNASAGVTATTLGQFINVGTVGGTTYTNPDSLTGTASCYVDTWYDQASTNDAEQTTHANQPQIHDGTVNTDVITENGKPALDFDGTNDHYDIASSLGITGSQARSTFFVLRPEAAGSPTDFRAYFGIGDNGVDSNGQIWDLWPEWSVRVFGGFEKYNAVTINNQYLSTNIFSGTNVTDNAFFLDGAEQTATSSTGKTVNTDNTVQRIGQSGSGAASSPCYTGKMQEVVIWASAQTSNRTGIESDINGYYSIYT